MFFPNACDVMAGFLGGRNNNINSSSVFVHEPFKTNFTSSASVKKDEVLTSFPGTVTLTNNCQVLNCPDCSKPCSGYTVLNTQDRQCNDSGNWYSCNVCCARFPALRDLELHAATQVRYCCCLCNAGFHCRELYENHITEHKNNIMNHQQVQHLQQPASSNCDNRKAAHTFEVDELPAVPVSTSVTSGFLPSITQTMSIAGQIPGQIVAFTELARSQHGSFFVTTPPSTNYVNQDYISIMSKDATGKGTYSIDSFQLSKMQNKELLQEAYPCGNNNNNINNDNAEMQNKVTEVQDISAQESYATISVSIQSMSEIGKDCTFPNQSTTDEGRRHENNQPEDKLDPRTISFVQFSDQSTIPQQFVCTLCGKVFKTKITLGKHVRTVHKVELGTGTDFVDFLTTSIAATTRLQQPSPSNTAVPGLDKINLLESTTLSEEMFSPLVKEQNLIEPSEEKKIFESAENEDLPQGKKKRIRSRKGSLGQSNTSRYQSSRVKYTCEVCDKEFIDKMKHRVHVRTHTGEKPYACDICGKLFNTRSQVNRHRLHIHELEGKPRNRQYKNRPSGESTGKSTEGSTSGVNISFGENQISANSAQQNINGSSDCPNASSAQEGLNQSTTSNDALVNSVVYCSKTGQRVDLSETTGGGPQRRRRGLHRIYFCPVCGKPFQDKVKHAVHLRTHTGEKPYACIVCDKRFNTRSQVNRHMSVHKSIFQNPMETAFASEGALDNIKSEDVGQEVAPEVQLGQLSQQDSQNILRLQTGVQDNNMTQQTEATFVGKTSKKKRNRDWQQSHICTFCGQNFATPSGLSSHTRNRHKDQIIFNHHLFDASSGTEGNAMNQTKELDASRVCQVCGKSFRAANSLRMHMIRHSSIKPHKCPICERCFITKFELNRCQRRHNKAKSQGGTFQQGKIISTNHPVKPGNADATLVTGFSSESLAQPAICQRAEETIPRTDTVAFPVTSNFSELTDQSANNLPVNLSNQETWLQQGYIQQTSIQQQNREAFMQKAVVAHYQQMQQVPSPHHQFLQQQIPQELFQVMSHNMIHYTLQQDSFPQQLQQQTQQQQQQQQAPDQIINNSKRRRRMII